jgi:hypothetical protein
MTRIAVIFTFFLAACDVGTIQQAGTGTDGGTGSGSGSNGVVCETISANIPAGHHNPGMSCITAGCHLDGQLGTGAPAYSYAGTVYKDVAGTIPYPGATIFVKLGATEKKVIAADNGNFWMVPGVAGLDAPTNAMTATTKGSACPNSPPMVGALVQAGGNCNNCHRTGGTTAVLP